MTFSLLPIAYAATETNAAVSPHTADSLSSILLLVGFVVIFYFLLWRPQSKRMKEQKKLLANLAKGDEVITAGGILGKITKVSDDFLMLAIAEGIEITVQKSAITNSLPKGTLKTI